MNENRNSEPPATRALNISIRAAFLLLVVSCAVAPFFAFGGDDPKSPAALAARFFDRDPKVRAAVEPELLAAGVTAIPALLARIKGAAAVENVTIVIAKMGPAAVPALIGLLKDGEVGSRAGEMLFQAARPEYSGELPKLVACLKDPATRDACGRALVRVMSPAAAEHRALLETTLKDPDPVTRAYAASALGQLAARGKPAVPALMEALKDPEATVRATAAIALGKFGKKAKAAEPALAAASADPDGDVRRLSAEALRKVRGESHGPR